MSQFTQEPLRFPPVDGLSVRADFDGGAMSSDFGPLILRGVDQQIGLTERLAQVIDDRRHPSDVTHLLRDRIAPCVVLPATTPAAATPMPQPAARSGAMTPPRTGQRFWPRAATNHTTTMAAHRPSTADAPQRPCTQPPTAPPANMPTDCTVL